MVAEGGDWFGRAACLGLDTELWFPPESLETDAREAKAVCRSCPVAERCLAHALAAGPGLHGIWGGATRRERRLIRADAQALP